MATMSAVASKQNFIRKPRLRRRTPKGEIVERPSRISIPEHAHPHARLVFALMARYSVTYEEMEGRSGVLHSTVKSWRKEKCPSLAAIEACLGSVGWSLVPCPPLGELNSETRAIIDDLALEFLSDEAPLAAVIACAVKRVHETRPPKPAARAPILHHPDRHVPERPAA